jgi:hypothetical protein
MNTAYVVAALHGTFRLARFDPTGMAKLDLSLDGFRRSFFAAVICLPVVAYFRLTGLGQSADPTWFATIQLIGYAAGWAAFPLAMIPVTLLLRLTRGYVPYIVANNWAAVWQAVLLLPTLVLKTAGADQAMAAVYLITLGIILSYQWFIARTALGAGPFMAVAVVVVQFLVEFAVVIGADYLAS